MNRILRILLATAVLPALVACGGNEQEMPPPPIRPVKIFEVEGISGEAMRRFPGSISASQRAALSFRVGGVLQKIEVREGERVKAGQLLAALDPTDYEIRLNDRQATFDNAQKNYNRGSQLVAEGNISQLDFDRLEANFRTSQAALDAARQELEYTRLKAPFAGSIGRREVENFEEVTANQPIFQLQNLEQLDVSVDLPENLVRSLQRDQQVENVRDARVANQVETWASFEGRDGERFSLEFKEVSTKADAQTQTFRVTLTMPQPQGFSVLPGMTANVFMDFSKVVATDSTRWIPVTAVVADSGLDAQVWVLDGESMTVSPRPVTIGRMAEGRIEVISGLSGGEEIVSVGAVYLADGMQVSRMQLTEQAEPRADDPG
jgi:RND family efflux transporter MFP subunit